MQGFRPQDYVISALVIMAVLTGWFLVVASFMNIIEPKAGIPAAIIIGLGLYTVINRRKPKA